MFKSIVIGAALAAALSGAALAADVSLPPVITKGPVAVPVPTCDLTGCTGAYLGGQMSASGVGVNVLNIGSLNANGSFMGLNGGYQMFNGAYWIGVKAIVEYEVMDPPTSVIGGALSNKIFAFEGVEFGGNLSSLFPNIAPLTGFLANAVPTVLVGACQHGSLTGECAGAAAHFFVPNSRWTVDAMYLNAQYQGGTNLGAGVTGNTENKGSLGASYHF